MLAVAPDGVTHVSYSCVHVDVRAGQSLDEAVGDGRPEPAQQASAAADLADEDVLGADIARCLDESPGDVTAAQHREGASELVGQSPQPPHLGLRRRLRPTSNHNTGTTPPPREPRAAAQELL